MVCIIRRRVVFDHAAALNEHAPIPRHAPAELPLADDGSKLGGYNYGGRLDRKWGLTIPESHHYGLCDDTTSKAIAHNDGAAPPNIKSGRAKGTTQLYIMPQGKMNSREIESATGHAGRLPSISAALSLHGIAESRHQRSASDSSHERAISYVHRRIPSPAQDGSR